MSNATSLQSKSKRTAVSVGLGEEGKGLITVTQDGRTIHTFSIPEEQAGADGVPKSER